MGLYYGVLWPLLSVISTVEQPVGPGLWKGLKLMLENSQLNIQNEKTKDGCESLMHKSQRNILKKRRQGLQMLRTRREEALREAEWGHI